jgi:hypothetical protein
MGISWNGVSTRKAQLENADGYDLDRELRRFQARKRSSVR